MSKDARCTNCNKKHFEIVKGKDFFMEVLCKCGSLDLFEYGKVTNLKQGNQKYKK